MDLLQLAAHHKRPTCCHDCAYQSLATAVSNGELTQKTLDDAVDVTDIDPDVACMGFAPPMKKIAAIRTLIQECAP